MIPILVLTHGDVGAVLLQAAESMLGRQEHVAVLGLDPSETRESFVDRTRKAVADLGGTPLVLVDLAGGTPWNVALLAGLAGGDGEVLAGVNLPVLLEALGRCGLPGSSPRGLAADLVAVGAEAFAKGSELIARGTV